MSRLRRILVPLGAAAALTSVAAFAAATAEGSGQRCSAAHISAKMTVIRGSAGAGHIGYKLTLKNSGRHSCSIGNHPGLKLLNAKGRGLPTHVTKFGKQRTVTIKPGHSAGAKLRFSPDVNGPGEHGRTCEPAAHKVRVFLTASKSVVGPVTPATSVCEHGAIQEQALS
jgi:hypothetical protein